MFNLLLTCVKHFITLAVKSRKPVNHKNNFKFDFKFYLVSLLEFKDFKCNRGEYLLIDRKSVTTKKEHITPSGII